MYIFYGEINILEEVEGMKYKCKKCGTEFDVEYDVRCTNCGERWEVEPLRLYKLRTAQAQQE